MSDADMDADMDTDLPSLIAGCATFGDAVYTEGVSEDAAYETLQVALSSGQANAIDTSPWYAPSEQLIGSALARLREEGFPRSSYRLMTKCGRYRSVDIGPGKAGSENDFRPTTIRWSVERSLQLLKTDYLDVCYLHDVEFKAECVGAANEAGCPCRALHHANASSYGLAPDQEATVYGPGDQQVLDAAQVLFEYKDNGVIRNVGMSGYPLPALLRLAILIQSKLGRPLDYVLSYGHHTLRTIEPGYTETNLQRFAPQFVKRAGVKQIINASPFEMGLLAYGGPAWHPAPEELKDICKKMAQDHVVVLTNLHFGTRVWNIHGTDISVPTVIGWQNAAEAKAALVTFAEPAAIEPTADQERRIADAFQKTGYGGWQWRSGTSSR